MADLKSLKLRITGVKKTEKITKAMKMVAASKLRRARSSAEACRKSYDQILVTYNNCLQNLAVCDSEKLDELPFIVKDKVSSHLLVVVTTDRGLCGGLNSNITKFTLKRVAELRAQNIDVSVAVYGKKSYEQIKAKSDVNIIFNRLNNFSDDFSALDAEKICSEIAELTNENNISNVSLIFPEFESAMSQIVVEQPLFIDLSEVSADDNSGEVEYEPDFINFAKKFIELKINYQIFHAMREAYACEQGARMTAMDNAVNNCKDLVKRLNLVYNRTRQAKITTELVEIIAASESI